MKDILIVEDGLHERERLRKLFCEANFSVASAESVGEAEKLLSIEQFRLVILDIGLGDKSGSYLFQSIKRSGQVSFVVILTGNPSIHLKQRFLDEGAAAYIVKASAAAENEALLDRIWARCMREEFTYRHKWRAGDLLMWDNRSTMHRRDPFDAGARRVMHRTQLKGDRSVEAAA